MKFLILYLILSITLNVMAHQDVQIWEGEFGEKLVYIDGLQNDLFQKYVIKDSKGPKWGQDVDFIASVVQEDFYERHTYWAETGYPNDKCPHFSIDDFEEASESGYGLHWKSIKKKTGSDKSIFYLAVYTIEISTPVKKCTYEQDSNRNYVFLNKVVNGVPVYLGYLTATLKK